MRTVVSFMLFFGLAAIAASPRSHAQALACGTTLYSSVTLSADMVCKGSHGLIVGADDVRISLNGYNIIGHPPTLGSGIVSVGFERIKILGPGMISGFRSEISIDGGDYHVIRGVEVFSRSLMFGVSLHNSSGSVIEESRLQLVHVASGPGGRAAANRIINNVFGYRLAVPWEGISLTGCGTFENAIAGNHMRLDTQIRIGDGAHSNLVAYNGMEDGRVVLNGSSHNRIVDNTFRTHSGLTGFANIILETWPAACAGGAVLSSNRNIVYNNQFLGGYVGIALYGFPGPSSTGNQITGNTFQDLDVVGVVFDWGADNNDARNNNYVNVPVLVVDYGVGNLWP